MYACGCIRYHTICVIAFFRLLHFSFAQQQFHNFNEIYKISCISLFFAGKQPKR